MKERVTHPLQELGLPHQTLQLASLSKGGGVANNMLSFLSVFFVYLVKKQEQRLI